MRKLLMTTTIAVGLAFAGAASAAPITFDFTSGPFTVNLGASETYTVGGVTITAYAASLSGTTVTRGGVLVGNNRGADEQGLGVCGSTQNCNGSNFDNAPEIDFSPRELVQLDITNLLAAGYNSLSVNADSATAGELLDAYASTASGGLGTFRASISSAAGNVSVLQNGNFLNFVSDNSGAGGDDVILHSLTADKVAVPEPVSLALLGVGLMGMGVTRRLRSRS